MADKTADKMNDTSIEESRGNIFADLGFPYADREELKAKLMLEICRSIKDRRLTQVEAGEVLGIQQPHVSALMNGRSGNYSLGRLFEFLNALGPRCRDCRAAQSAGSGRRPYEHRGGATVMRYPCDSPAGAKTGSARQPSDRTENGRREPPVPGPKPQASPAARSPCASAPV